MTERAYFEQFGGDIDPLIPLGQFVKVLDVESIDPCEVCGSHKGNEGDFHWPDGGWYTGVIFCAYCGHMRHGGLGVEF